MCAGLWVQLTNYMDHVNLTHFLYKPNKSTKILVGRTRLTHEFQPNWTALIYSSHTIFVWTKQIVINDIKEENCERERSNAYLCGHGTLSLSPLSLHLCHVMPVWHRHKSQALLNDIRVSQNTPGSAPNWKRSHTTQHNTTQQWQHNTHAHSKFLCDCLLEKARNKKTLELLFPLLQAFAVCTPSLPSVPHSRFVSYWLFMLFFRSSPNINSNTTPQSLFLITCTLLSFSLIWFLPRLDLLQEFEFIWFGNIENHLTTSQFLSVFVDILRFETFICFSSGF